MVRNHRKPLKAMVATSKNHRKTIDGNGQTAQKHSMVMVSSKTIENLQWSLHFSGPRYVDLYAFAEDGLQRVVEDISRCYLIFHSSFKYLDMILSSFGDMILTRDSIVNLKTIVDHCPQNFENHRKTIGSNGWTPKKTFNGDGPTLSKPLKNH